MTLREGFITWRDGFSPNAQDILAKFHFRNQIQRLVDHHISGYLTCPHGWRRVACQDAQTHADQSTAKLEHDRAVNHILLGSLAEQTGL